MEIGGKKKKAKQKLRVLKIQNQWEPSEKSFVDQSERGVQRCKKSWPVTTRSQGGSEGRWEGC